MSSKKNIVFFMADDLGFECLGVNGSSFKTPNLDKLAQRGVNFKHCYSTPLCTPSRVQVMTGRYGFRNYEGFCFLNPTETTFANSLKKVGYATAITGKWQLGGDASRVRGFGFDEHCLNNMGIDHQAPNKLARERYADPLMYLDGAFLADEEVKGKYGPDICRDFALDFIERKKEQPFFLYYPMLLVHAPFCPTPDSPEWANPDTRKTKNNRFYKDMVEYMDKIIGQIIAKLEATGQLENTLILFTGDNGTPQSIALEMSDGSSTQGGKGYMPDAGTHVPLLTSLSNLTPNGFVSEDLVDFSDIFPTIADAVQAPMPENVIIDGRSIFPQICGKKGNPRDWAFCHYDPMVPFGDWQEQAGRWARNQRYKLYNDGRFYDVPADQQELSPIQPDISREASQIHGMLEHTHKEMPPFEERGAPCRSMSKEQRRRFVSDFIGRR